MAAIIFYYQVMAMPEAICGKCIFFDRKDVNGQAIGTETTGNGDVDKGLCRTPMGLILGVRRETDSYRMPEGTFEAVPTSLTQGPSILQVSPSL